MVTDDGLVLFHISDPCDTVLQTVSLDKGVYRRNSKHPSNRYTMRDPQRQHSLFKDHKVDTHLNSIKPIITDKVRVRGECQTLQMNTSHGPNEYQRTSTYPYNHL